MYWDSLDSFGVQQTFDQWALSDCPSWHAHGGKSLVNSVAAVSLIKFIFSDFKKIVLNLGTDLHNF